MDHGRAIIRKLDYTGGHYGDHNPYTKDFLRQNDAHGKPLTTSAASALEKMFNVNRKDVYIRADGQGKIATQFKDVQGNLTEHTKFYDINTLKPEERKDFEYHAKRHIISEHMNIAVKDLNNLKEINGKYHFKDRDGHDVVEQPDKTEKQNIERDISLLGLDNNKQYMSYYIARSVLWHIAGQETKNETDPGKKQGREDKIKKGTVYSYEYDKKNDQYKFYIIQEGKNYTNRTGKADGEMMEVTIDQKSLPSQVKNGLEYHERKIAVMNEFSSREGELQDLKIVNGELNFKEVDGILYKIKPTDSQLKNIEVHLAAKGFSNNTQRISDSVENAALHYAIGKETDPARKVVLADAMVYDYAYDKKNKEHIYHVVTKEIPQDGLGGTEVRDGEMKKVSFTHDEHQKILDAATLNAVRKYGELPDGRKITDGMVVAFNPNDKSQFLVTDTTDGGVHTLTGDSNLSDGRGKLKNAIDTELNVKPRDETRILTEKSPDIMIGTGDKSDKVVELEKKLEEYENWTKHTLRFLKFMGAANDMALQAAQDAGQVAAELLHAQDNPNQQQPPGSVATAGVRSWAKKRVKHNIKLMKEEIKIEKKTGTGKGAIAGKLIEKMEELKELIKKNKGPNDKELGLSKEDQEELLRNMDNDSDSSSDSSDEKDEL